MTYKSKCARHNAYVLVLVFSAVQFHENCTSTAASTHNGPGHPISILKMSLNKHSLFETISKPVTGPTWPDLSIPRTTQSFTTSPEAPNNTSKQRSFLYHSYTLYLLTKSDIKTVLVPQPVFVVAAMISAGAASHEVQTRFIPMFFWIWLHLVVEDLSNQRKPGSIAEDAINKPWRPLPSGRLSSREALGLLCASITLAMVTSLLLGAVAPSVSFLVLVWLYNEAEVCKTSPILRNLLNVLGLACFGWGGISVINAGGSLITQKGQSMLYQWLALVGAAGFTTIHAQDLPDMVGDAARGRKTMPLLYGEGITRWSMAIFVMIWSVVCPVFCNATSKLVWSAPLGIASLMAGTTLFSRKVSSDEVVWRLWCIWTAILYILPLFGEFS